MMTKILATIFTIFISLSIGAFSCNQVVGETFLSPGDSDFQYQYAFKKGNSLSLKIFLTSHDAKGPEKMSLRKYNGTYEVDGESLTVKITVDKQKHLITFSCVDSIQYMKAGAFSKSLQVKKTIPANHGFSMIHLWPKNSKVISDIFSL